MSQVAEKRQRCPNWHASEKQLLVTLVEEHFSTVEMKKTDASSKLEKTRGWLKIARIYNSRTSLAHREALTLQKEWSNLKKNAKKLLGNLRMEANKTGGGPSKLRPLPPLYEKINVLIGRAAEGYHNPYDADAGMIQPTSGTCDESHQPVEEQQQQLEAVEEEGDDDATAAAQFTIQPELEFPERSETEVYNWASYNPGMLRTPVSASLIAADAIEVIHNGGEPETPNSCPNRKNRRRPTMAKSSVERLHEKKIEAIELQMKHAKEEREAAMKLNLMEREVMKEKIRQEKIKTRMLLKELKKM